MADNNSRIRRLRDEVSDAQREARDARRRADAERDRIVRNQQKQLRILRNDMDRAIRERDQAAQERYEKLLNKHTKQLEADARRELVRMNANYRRLEEEAERAKREAEAKNEELEREIRAIRDDINRRNEGSRENAEVCLAAAAEIGRDVSEKPHEKFLPRRLSVLENEISDSKQLIAAGLYEAAAAVAISARGRLELLSYEIDDKENEWSALFELLSMKLEFLRARLRQELDDWMASVGGADKALGRQEINYWSRGELEHVIERGAEIARIPSRAQKLGMNAYLRDPSGATVDDLRDGIAEVDRISASLSKFIPLYSLRATASAERADWGEELTDFLTSEINMMFRDDLSSFREPSPETLASRDFADYAATHMSGPLEDTREWLRLVFENASRDLVYIYIVPFEEAGRVENRVMIHSASERASRDRIAADIRTHVYEALGHAVGEIIVENDVERMKHSESRALVTAGKDIEKHIEADRKLEGGSVK